MTFEKRRVLLACILGSAVVFVDSTVINVALPALQEDLDASLAEQQWVVESFLLLLGSLVLIGGSLGDVVGRRKVFVAGVAGFLATSVACALAPTAGVLVAARALQGVTGALLVPSSLAIITAAFPDPAARGAAVGTWTAGTSGAIAVGPALGGFLVDAVGWRWVFAINVPLLLACLALCRHIPAWPPSKPGRHVDVPGALLCALGLAGPVFALIEQPSAGWGAPEVLGPLVAGLALLAAFVAVERRSPDPMLPPGLFAVRAFTVANAATLAVYAGLGAFTFFSALFLQQVVGWNALEAGLSGLPVTLCMVLLSRRFGALTGRIGPRLPMTLGPAAMGLGLLLYLRVDRDATYVADVLPAVLLFGLGLSLTVAPLTATVLDAVGEAQAGVASGVNNAVARVAGLLAIAAVGAVVAAKTGTDGFRTRDLDDAEDGFHAGMVVSACLVLAGGVVSAVGLRHTDVAA